MPTIVARPKILFVESVRTSADLTPNSTTWANLDAGLDLTVSAAVDDMLMIGVNGSTSNEAIALFLTVSTIVSAAPVNDVSTRSAENVSHDGVMGWFAVGSAYLPLTGQVPYKVVSGDIASGGVTLRLRYKTSSAAVRTIRANANEPFRFWVQNIRQ